MAEIRSRITKWHREAAIKKIPESKVPEQNRVSFYYKIRFFSGRRPRRPDSLFNRKITTIRKAAVANFATAASFWLIILIYRKLSLYGSSVNCFYYSFPASFLYLSSLSVFSSSASTKSFSASSGCAFFKVA